MDSLSSQIQEVADGDRGQAAGLAKWTLHEHIDCKDPYKKWLDAVIIDLKILNGAEGATQSAPNVDIKVSYTEFSEKYDEWIVAKDISGRVLKQWEAPSKSGTGAVGAQEEQLNFDELNINNRIDVYDTSKSKWREARVIDIQRVESSSLDDGSHQGSQAIIQSIKVHFKGLHSKFDEVIAQKDFKQLISPISHHQSKRKGGKKGQPPHNI